MNEVCSTLSPSRFTIIWRRKCATPKNLPGDVLARWSFRKRVGKLDDPNGNID